MFFGENALGNKIAIKRIVINCPYRYVFLYAADWSIVT